MRGSVERPKWRTLPGVRGPTAAGLKETNMKISAIA